jgi:hypothetical protein
MPSRNMDVAPDANRCAPVLTAALLDRVHRINCEYIELLIDLAVDHDPRDSLSPATIADIRSCRPEQRRTLSACSFSLYSLGFEQREFWITTLNAVQSLTLRQASENLDRPSHRVAFCEIAVTLAWYVAIEHAVAARLMFSMADDIVARLRNTPLWQLKRIAHDSPGVLTPRWPGNSRFWPELVRGAVANDADALQTARLLGTQLIAAEVEAANGGRPAAATGSVKLTRQGVRKTDVRPELRRRGS